MVKVVCIYAMLRENLSAKIHAHRAWCMQFGICRLKRLLSKVLVRLKRCTSWSEISLTFCIIERFDGALQGGLLITLLNTSLSFLQLKEKCIVVIINSHGSTLKGAKMWSFIYKNDCFQQNNICSTNDMPTFFDNNSEYILSLSPLIKVLSGHELPRTPPTGESMKLVVSLSLQYVILVQIPIHTWIKICIILHDIVYVL